MPLVTSGLVFRYEADVGVTTSGSDVTVWNDQVGSRHLDFVFGTPQLTTSPSGEDAISFDGVDDALMDKNTSGLPSALAARTLISVVSYGAATSDNVGCGYGRNSTRNGWSTTNSTGGFAAIGGGGTINYNSSTTVASAGWKVMCITLNTSGDYVIVLDDSSVLTGTDNTLNTYAGVNGRISVGCRIPNSAADPSLFGAMTVGGFMLYDRVLSAAEITEMDTYLRDKYITVGGGSPQTWTKSTQEIDLTATSGSFTPGAVTWTKSTQSINVTATSGSFVAGAVTWTASTQAIDVTATPGSFVAGGQVWAASTQEIDLTPTSGSFTPGTTVWSASTQTVDLTPTSGSFTPGAVTWTASSVSVDLTATSGSFVDDSAVWTKSTYSIEVTPRTGRFIGQSTRGVWTRPEFQIKPERERLYGETLELVITAASWANTGGGYDGLRVSKVGGIVTLTGSISASGAASSETLVTLDPRWRPAATLVRGWHLFAPAGAPEDIIIVGYSTGDVTIGSVTDAGYTLVQMSWWANYGQ